MQSPIHPASLAEVPSLFARLTQSPALRPFLAAVLDQVPRQGTACEVACGSGYASIWLSQRSVRAHGFDADATNVERTRQINDILGGHAQFWSGDAFQFFAEEAARYDVVHHHGLLHRYAVPWIRALLAQQVVRADKVVFSVPSVYFPHEPGPQERLLPLEEWRRILEPFRILDLRYVGDPRHEERDSIVCVLEGQEVDEALRSLMTVPAEPYPQGISAIVQTRNEARHIHACLETLQGWTDEIIVCDMESSDETVEIARRFTDQIIEHPRLINFDRARNVPAMRARYRWVFYLDADERVPPGMGAHLRELVTAPDADFAAIATPFRTIFMGGWLQSLYPGYKAPPLYKNGKFFYNTEVHAGAQVDGRVAVFPANNPEASILHLSYDGLDHYLDKLKRYSTAEALNLDLRGAQFAWQNAVRDFVRDFAMFYDHLDGGRDGVHGFFWSFLGGVYRFMQHAKLYERRFRDGRLQPNENQVPASLEEVLEYALQVLRAKPTAALPPIRVQEGPLATSPPPSPEAGAEGSRINQLPSEAPADLVWSGALHDASDYGEESRSLVNALVEVGEMPAAHDLGGPLPIQADSSSIYARLPALLAKPAGRGFVHVINHTPSAFFRHPAAALTIGLTMFETDRLPAEWIPRCNALDFIWVPSEFNRRTFIQAGVEAQRLRVIPSCLDTDFWRQLPTQNHEITAFSPQQPFIFVSVFAWSARKGWDVLLRAFLAEFQGQDDVRLVINASCRRDYPGETPASLANTWAREELGYDLASDPRVQFITEPLTREELRALYARAHAFMLPSRGEGWGRPSMEAMACGLPVIGTGWSGNTAFMNADNSYLIEYDLVPVAPEFWAAMPLYRGHRWAEPRLGHLQQLMRRVYEQREEAVTIGDKARQYVLNELSCKRVGALIRDEVARVREELRTGTTTGRSTGWVRPVSVEKVKQNLGEGDAGGDTVEARSDTETVALADPAIPVRWEGSQFLWHSLAHVNRELCLQLLDRPDIELSLVPFEADQFSPTVESRYEKLARHQFAPLSRPAAVHVRHFYPPRLTPASEGHLVLMQHWEYGYLPKNWIEPIRGNMSEVWCCSRYVRDVFVNSGIDEAKVHIIPLGVDTDIYNPEAPLHVFTIEAGAQRLLPTANKTLAARRSQPFLFLFVGGTLHRKGIDILLQAYLNAFTAYDDVCLVIKDTGTSTVYRGSNQRERILGLIDQDDRPRIVYLDADLSSHQMAGLYTACDCLVQPYRGEGFCLPALEAMACGLAVIATEGGSTDDFVDEAVGWRIPARKQLIDQNHIGTEEFVAPPWWLEVDSGALVELLRHTYRNRDEVKERGATGAQRVAQGWTWHHAADAVVNRLQALAALPSPPPREDEVGVRPENLTPRRQPTISLCMIVRDEERVLEACLQSAKPWFDEIIVVDTGSRDRTVEIAQQQGARVFHFPWCDDFSAARNESLRHATGEWVFWMDADDTLPAECGAKLRELAVLAEERTTGFIVQVQIPAAPGEVGFTIVDHVKLFRNRPELRFTGRIHEQILEPIHKTGGRVERSDAFVVHSGYDYSPVGQEKKRVRDLTLLEKDLADRPAHPFVLFNIGMTAYHMKDYAKAIDALEQCLQMSKPQESTVRKVYAMLAGCYSEQRQFEAAKAYIERGLAIYPHDPELLFRAGAIYRELGDLERAAHSYVTLLTHREQGHVDSLDVTMTGFKAHHNLALIYQDMDRLEDAEGHFRQAVTLEPNFVPSLAGLAETYRRMNRPQDVQDIERKMRDLQEKASLVRA